MNHRWHSSHGSAPVGDSEARETTDGGRSAEGGLEAFTGVFVTQFPLRSDGSLVSRISVGTDDGTLRRVVLPDAHSDELYDLRTGAKYAVVGRVVRSPADLSRAETPCPGCGSELRERGLVDEYEAVARTAELLELGDSFLVCEEIRPPDESNPLDDRMGDGPTAPRRPPDEFVCTSCGESFAASERRAVRSRPDAEREAVGDGR
jgi:hypothetical protein